MLLEQESYDLALRLLAEAYPDAKPALEYRSPFELLVSTMLAAQCTDRQVNKCTRVLYAKYNTPEQFAALTEEELKPYIHSCGFFNTKGKNIIAMSKILTAQYGGQVPADRDVLTTLPGVGRKTANVVVSNAFGIPAIAVDTHVFRVTNRIGFADAKNVEKTEEQLMEHIPREDWSAAHHWLIYHGRQVCDAKKPRCADCCVACVCDAFHRG
ncbi:MAG: endonuclease III [bacterium]|nr:endonuclease III [bacterium]